ncbi:hypothetical protein [Calothrix sp. NIES-3974]|uniref:hypothetical protein n=1 Tax=Calothrix sp. NIES-3974 TaxID=2005462 RepID=UPI000B6012FA|nr:hypothetical protein [Calothrix sp. NIES-3974]BAZ04558.1 hypothetical protein NIES3974_11980 [Calothrix sp. NIES-3974]
MLKQGSLDIPILENRQLSSLAKDKLGFTGKNHDICSHPELTDSDNFEYICLNLETLRCFEVVTQQYADVGVIFENCIAIHPSNPAFPTASGNIVLLAAPNCGLIQVNFLQPVKIVKAFVTSSQRLEMSAYNRDRQLVDRSILVGANLANSNSSVPPNMLVQVQAAEIHAVTFSVLNGQFTVDDFSFCR